MGMVTRGIAVFIVSIVLFYFSNIPLALYLLLLSLIFGFILYFFHNPVNCEFHGFVLAGVAGNLAAYLLVFLGNDSEMVIHGTPEPDILPGLMFTLFLCPIVVIEFKFAWKYAFQKNPETNGKIQGIFKPHEYDVQRIRSLLKVTRILGINGSWGNGKSFVVDYLCEQPDVKDSYFVIKIEALAYRYDEFDRILVAKLESLLRSQGIFSFYASEIMHTLDKSIWGRFIFHYFHGTDSGNTTAFKGLKADLEKLPKKVLIIFEDLERVNSGDAVKKILAIVELLAGENVSVIYEYDKRQFNEQLSISQEYLEKYIPIEMNLTEISYRDIVSDLWDELEMDDVNVKITGRDSIQRSCKELIMTFTENLQSPFQLGRITAHPEFRNFVFPIRLVSHFLSEIKGALKNILSVDDTKKKSIDDLQIRTVVAFFFVKNFMYTYYDRLRPGYRLDDCLPLKIKNSDMNLETLYHYWGEHHENDYNNRNARNEKDSKEVSVFDEELISELNRQENKWIIGIYSLFPYEVEDYNIQLNLRKTKKKLSTDDMQAMEKAEEQRNACNHLIWNLLQNGRSEFTDEAACAQLFIDKVLSQKSSIARKKAWIVFNNDLYNEHIYKDNRTINYIGHNPVVDIAKALALKHRSPAIWKEFMDFVAMEWEDKPIDVDLIHILNRIELGSFENLFYSCDRFNRLRCAGNFNTFEPYWHFLNSYINKFTGYGFLSPAFYNVIDCTWSNTAQVKEILEEMIREVQKDSLMNVSSYNRQKLMIERFLNKNLEITQLKPVSKEKKPKVSITECKTVYPHQKTLEGIVKLMDAAAYSDTMKNEIEEKLNGAYTQGMLYPTEVRLIREHMKKWEEGTFTG